MAHGGDAVGRADGKAYFINGALPGETVTVTDVIDRGSFAKARLDQVVQSSADRVEPTCPHFDKCGGCQWQYADYGAQLRMKHDIVAGQLRHIGRLTDPVVRDTVAPGSPLGYRNKMAFNVVDGRPGQFQKGTHIVEPIDACQLLVPELADLYSRLGSLDGVNRIVIRTGTRTGESLVVIDGVVPPHADEWSVAVLHRDRGRLTRMIGADHIHEVVSDVRFRITGPAFFQVNTPGADVLVDLVQEALQPTVDDVLLDAYSGGGLFSATVGRGAGRVVAVETGPEAVGDLQHNLRVNDCFNAEMIDGRVEDVLADPVDDWTIAICDPPRTGLGAAGVMGIVQPRPRAVAYVSCDPASFARDVRYFNDVGYELSWATPVDLFPQSFHVETVGLLVEEDEGFGY
jgi:23S rRNA (uracil1939-C5)-methyltransferase